MACKPALLTLAAVVIGLLPPATFATSPLGFRATITRARQYPGNYSAAARRDGRRLASLSNAAAGGAHTSTGSSSRGLLQALVENGAGAYHMTLSIGTPPLAFLAILDTGSDLTWTQCAPCTACFPQPTPLYDPAASSTSSSLPCASPPCQALPSAFRACNATGCAYDYRYTVGFTVGYLAADTLALGGASFPGVAFGFTTSGAGGVIVDSGTTFTYLAEAGYAMVRQAFVSQMAGVQTVSGAPYDFDLCFAAGAAVPVLRLVLRFAGGAEYAVPRRSYLDAVDERGGVACLLVLPTRGVSVIGNVMQMDLHVLYDVDGGAFSFAPADCASL